MMLNENIHAISVANLNWASAFVHLIEVGGLVPYSWKNHWGMLNLSLHRLESRVVYDK